MATNYGMGQYRMQQGTKYISLIGENIEPKFVKVKANQYTYRDIYFDLKNIGNSENSENNNFKGFQYGYTYYLELTLPRHIQYSSDIDIKICGSVSDNIDIENQFQNIQQIIVPNSLANSNYYKDVLLYALDGEDSPTEVGIVTNNANDTTLGHIIYVNKTYQLIAEEEGEIRKIPINKYQISRIVESWNLVETNKDTITYKMIFSPKFNNGSEGYPYLYLEIDRNNDWNANTQYVIDGEAYRGLYINPRDASLNVYRVENLLGADNGIPSSSLNHIGIWGHPEMYLAINGEQVQIGKNGFYELDDFDITNLGVVVTQSDIDEGIGRFSIDYEYKKITS